MAVTSGFFNAVSSDRTYNAEQMTTYFEGLVSDGIYENIGDKFQVTAGEGMSVSVGSGRALVKTHWIKNDSALSLSIDAASTQYNRIDAVVLKYDATAREISIIVKKGNETSGVPSAPEATRTNDVYELWLATVRVMKNTSAITQAMITDFRTSALCGYVTGLIQQVDTSTLFAQWQAAYEAYYAQATAAFDAYMAAREDDFNTWFASLTSELRVDTTLHQFYNAVSVSGTTSEIMIGINDYDSNSDLLLAFANGVYLVGGTDYTISGTGAAAKINLQNPLTGTNFVNFVVVKSVIGEGSGALNLSANLMEYEAGVTDLEHGFVVLDSSGTVESGTYTIGGTEYSGLRLAGASTIGTPDNMSVGTLRAKVIITDFGVDGNQRIFSPKRGDDYNWRFAVWTSSGDNRLRYNLGNCEILDNALVNLGYGVDYADPNITKSSLQNNELTIEIRNDNTGYRTLYVNDVAKAKKWTEGSAGGSTARFAGIWNSFTIGGNGTTGNDLLITEFKWIIER